MLEQILNFIEQNQSWIMLVPTILFVVIVVLWTIRGFMKGFRKGIIQFILMLVAIALSVLVFALLTADRGKMLYQLFGSSICESTGISMPDDFNQILNTNVRPEDVTLIDCLFTAIFKQAEIEAGGIEYIPIEAYDSISAVAEMTFRIGVALIALIAFFIFKILLYLLVYLPFFKEKRYQKKLERRKKVYKKRRILGGVVGLVRGGIVGVCCVGLIGTLLYLVTAGREPQETKFTDETISNVYDIDNMLKEFGNTGVLKAFNNIKVDDVPFYIFFVNSIAQAESTETGEVYYFVNEITSLTGLGQDLLDVFNLYGGESITIDHIKGSEDTLQALTDLFNSDNKLEYDGDMLTFEEALTRVVEQYEGTVLFFNLAKAAISTCVLNIETLTEGTGLEDSYMVNVVTTMFTSEDNDPYYISPYDLVTGNDIKEIFVGLTKSIGEILNLMNYKDTTDPNSNTYNIGQINRTFAIISPIQESLNNLSIFTNNPEDVVENDELIVKEKRTKINRSLDRAIDYSFKYFSEELGNNYENPYLNINTDWLNDLDDIIASVNDISQITISIENEMIEANTNLFGGLDMVFAADYQNREVIDNAYDELVNKIADFDSVSTLFESDLMYDLVYDNFLNQMLNSVNNTTDSNIKMPRNITWQDEDDTPGEFRVLFNTLRELVRSGVLDELANENYNLITVDSILATLSEQYDEDETLINYTLNSKVLYYSMSLLLTNLHVDDLEVLVPDEAMSEVEGVKLINKEELANLLLTAKPVVSELIARDVIEFADITADINVLLDVMSLENVQDSIISSDILVATASNYLVNTVDSDESIANYIVIPSYLAYTDDNETNQIIMKNWLGEQGEFANLLHTLTLTNEDGSKVLDIEKLINNDTNYYVSLMNISRPNFDSLIASDIMHYSFTNILTTMPSQDSFSLIIPKSAYDVNYEGNVISSDELYNTLHAASLIAYVNENNELDYNLDNVQDNSSDVLKSMIIHASLINSIYQVSLDNDYIKLPNVYNNLNYDSNSDDYIFNQDFDTITWVANKEILNILEATKALDIKLNSLIDGSFNQDEMTNKILLLNDELTEGTNKGKYIIEVVDASKVLAMTMTNLLSSEDLSAYVSVPDTAKTEADNYGDSYVKDSEWYQLVSGLEYSLGINASNEESVLEQLQNINNYVSNIFIGDYKAYEDKRDILLKSYILEATVVTNIYSNLENNDTLVIPNYLSQDEYVNWYTEKTENNDTDLARRISIVETGRKELSNIMDVFKVTEIGEIYGEPNFEDEVASKVTVYSLVIVQSDYENVDEFDTIKINKLNVQATLVKSNVLKASTLNTILRTNAVDIPSVDRTLLDYEKDNYNDIVKTNISEEYLNISFINEDYNTDDEMKHIFDALNELALNVSEVEPNTINMNANVILTLNEESMIQSGTKLTNVLNSTVLSLTLTNELASAIDFITLNDLENDKEQKYAVEIINGDMYVRESEWSRLIDSLGEQGLGLSENDDIAEKLANPIGLVNNVIGDPNDNPASDDEYIARRDTIFGSVILEAAIKVKVEESISSNESSEDEVATVVPIDTPWYLTRKDNGEVDINSSSEMTNVLDVFKIIGVEDGNENYGEVISSKLNAADILVLSTDDESTISHKIALQQQLFSSYILHATMINNVMGIESLVKPSVLTRITNDMTLSDTLWILNSEMANLFGVADMLQLTGEGNQINFDVDNILSSLKSSADNKPIDRLYSSSLAYLTVSNNVLDTTTNTTLGIMILSDDVREYNGNYNDLAIRSIELQALIDDLNYLGISSISNETEAIKVPGNDILNNEALFSSNTLRITISNKIITNTMNDSTAYVTYIPTDNEDILSKNIITKVEGSYIPSEQKYYYFDAAELRAFIKAINVMTESSSDNTSFTFSINNLSDITNMESNDLNTVLDSKIAHGILSNFLISVNETSGSEFITPTEGLVYHVTEITLESVTEEYIAKETIKQYVQN